MGTSTVTGTRSRGERTLWLLIAAAALAVVVGVLAIVVIHGHHATERVSPTPYSSARLEHIQQQCFIGGLGYPSVMDCYRDRLPKMTDQQLERLDYWISQQQRYDATH